MIVADEALGIDIVELAPVVAAWRATAELDRRLDEL
jgi:hypothetical protein